MPANGSANRYELKELLGEGGMGMVYRALDTRTNSYVALKTLRDHTDPTVLDMFKREWALLGEIPHPNIVDIRDVDEVEINGVRKPCFIMPLLPGCTLAALIKSSSPRLTTEFVVNMVAQVCKGLQAAHEKGLVHRDLKPSNIFIMDDDTAKIIDFGLVHAVGNKSVTGLKGTWQYMPPEQIDGSKQPNRSFDIFSLGVVAYETLTLHQPFKRAKFEDTVEAVRLFVPQSISELNRKVPQPVSKAIHLAMAKQPLSRYATARDFAETLQKAFQGQYIDRFDPEKIRPRIERAKKAFNNGDSEFAAEILTELEAEGNIDPDITLLRSQINEYNKHKRIRQLMEAAQTRLEQDEIPLAVDKLQEILKIDPQNQEALKMRKRIDHQRNERQVAEWLALARTHLERHDFAEARRALKEVFIIKYDDPDAGELQKLVDAREKEVQAARADKEHLYSDALRLNQNGEISSALSKLQKLIELGHNVPGAAVPERDKVFLSFYNDLRTERDRVESAYAEGARHLSEKHFAKALQVCDNILSRYPQNPQFQALRLKIENSERQQLSAYIAEVGHAVETEPNLDRRVSFLEEACRRYPGEAQFSRQLELARDHRELASSIVRRARDYEENGQFAEAITQWNTLANIHPQYPSIDFEVSQLQRRREQQSEEEKKGRLVERIDRALGNANYADAERISQEALEEFPQNPELLALQRLARQGLEQSREANALFEQAKQERTAGNLEEATGLLRRALDLDKRNIVIQNSLVHLLTERAHDLLDTDPAAAEPLAAEAYRLDPERPSVSKINSLIAHAKQRHYVEQTVVQARELQSQDRGQAISVLQQGLSVYPADTRLQQTLSSLQAEETRVNGIESPARSAAAAAGGATGIINGVAYPDEKTTVQPLNPKWAQNSPEAPPKPRPLVETPAPPQSTEPPHWRAILNKLASADFLKQRFGSSASAIIGVVLGLLASVVVIGLASWYLHRPDTGSKTSATPPPPPPPTLSQIKIDVTPSDAIVQLDGSPITGGVTPPLEQGTSHHITISRPGFKTVDEPAKVASGSNWTFALEPRGLAISISVAEKDGSVWLEDKQVGELSDGSWSGTFPLKTSTEHHVLAAKTKSGKPIFELPFTAATAKLPSVEPLETKDLLVTASLGNDAVVLSGTPGAKLIFPNDQRRPIPAKGIAIHVGDASEQYSVAAGKASQPLAFQNGPSLSVSLDAEPDAYRAVLQVNAKNPRLIVDGSPIHASSPGTFTWQAKTGRYPATLTAEGMLDESFEVNVKKGVGYRRTMVMRPRALPGTPSTTLLIKDSEPFATVTIGPQTMDDKLDAKGNGTYTVLPGTRSIIFSKPGFASSSQSAPIKGKTFEMQGPKLKQLPAYLLVTVQPANAVVSFQRAGADTQKIFEFGKPLSVPAGKYTLSAEAPGYKSQTITRDLVADKQTEASFNLVPNNEGKQDLVDKRYVQVQPDGWLHGISNGPVPLSNNVILLLSWGAPHHPKKMIWRVFLDDNNNLEYSFDGKSLLLTRKTDGTPSKQQEKNANLDGGPDNPGAWRVQIKVEKNRVILVRRDGSIVLPFTDETHDWGRATISIRGDNTFKVLPAR